MINAVFSHTAGLRSNTLIKFTIVTAPTATGNDGCSDSTVNGTTQDTWGSVLLMTSRMKSHG
ncbi:Uncharacterised protein [Mycobacterium tuberculosis]|uniref:Uncharacterized protein n=1 Tax=Mycobacterium tuberculosis TaxID=1773 RepID=A0A655IP25_MYCTX|nr:Uncharacterised protein [Mycobacterium tuberculosis]CKR78167.1 Uncharacterised protein [Mycobacterium tuberculosis]CNU84477.1 Uncharacterised protein [Mycobacterium tuberculosis]CNW39535.1 Uncharacterised protein [Mycobacterium tuberculosis]COW04911.1 Uncharacterised protein [Mycobacterium tuberculosis]